MVVKINILEAKDIWMVAGMVLLAAITIGGIVYDVYDTGEELTCRTGNGWTILEEYEGHYKAQCQYKTKEWVTAYCSSFRSTASYLRYGCQEVVLVQVENTVIENTVIENTLIENNIIHNPTQSGSPNSKWVCPPNGVPCILVE